MAKISLVDFENRPKTPKKMVPFFSLKNDRDTAQVRFMYENASDVTLENVHELTINGMTRYVSCLRGQGDSADVCPMCKARAKAYGKVKELPYKSVMRACIPVYNIKDDEVQCWTRSYSFVKTQLAGLMGRYNPLCGTIIEIERQGKPHETGTSYGLYPIKTDDTKLSDLPPVPEMNGGIMHKSYEDMQYYVENGCFPAYQGKETSEEPKFPQRRESKSDSDLPF